MNYRHFTWLLAALILVGAAACTDSGDDREAAVPVADVATWAALVCSAAQDFDDAVDAVADGIDPTSLTDDVDEYKARSARMTPRLMDAARAAAASLLPAATFGETREYTRALISQFEWLAGALEAAGERVTGTSTSAHPSAGPIFVRNETTHGGLDILMQAAEEEIVETASGLTPAAIAALRSVAHCGSFLS